MYQGSILFLDEASKGNTGDLVQILFRIKAPLLHDLVELLLAESEPHGKSIYFLLLAIPHDLILIDKLTSPLR